MSEPAPTRESLRAALSEHRTALHSIVDGRGEAALQAIQVSEQWNALDQLRHMLVWEEITVQALKNWQQSTAVNVGEHFDAWNEAQVQALSNLDMQAVMQRLDAAYGYLAEQLATNSDAELAIERMAPWGHMATRLNAIAVFYHDAEHLQELRNILEAH